MPGQDVQATAHLIKTEEAATAWSAGLGLQKVRRVPLELARCAVQATGQEGRR